MSVVNNRTVKECEGCKLNQGSQCAIFHHPMLKWKNRKCEGYNNPMYIKYYETTLKAHTARERKLERQTKAKRDGTTPHRDGTKSPKTRAKPARTK